jgi:hypothetical protein
VPSDAIRDIVVPLVRLPRTTTFCVQTLVVGVLVAPAIPAKVPPVILKVLLSQSKASSGTSDPIATIKPPLSS